MRKLSVIALAFVCYCGHVLAGDVELTDQYVNYKIENNKYAVIYVETENVSSEEAKKRAMERAAHVARENGYRYFTVEVEQHVLVAQTIGPKPAPMPSDMFEELIVERDFTKKPYESQTKRPAGLFPGVKLVINCYKESPDIEAIDACEMTKCE